MWKLFLRVLPQVVLTFLALSLFYFDDIYYTLAVFVNGIYTLC